MRLPVQPHSSPTHHAGFHSRRWSMVLAAGDPASSEDAAARALKNLCRLYWPPLYA